jgi:drug/metabolite transporter (DMT)-like permease
LFLVIVFVWSSDWIVLKYATGYVPPLLLLGTRDAVCVAILAVVLTLSRVSLPPKSMWKFLTAISLMFSLEQISWILGISLISAGESVILFYTYPLMVTLCSYLLAGENLNKTKLSGVVLGFSGVILFFSESLGDFSFNVVGYVFTLISALSWAMNLVYTKKWAQNVDSRMITLAGFSLATVFLLAVSAWLEGANPIITLRQNAVLPLLYAAFGNLLALTLWYGLVKRLEPTTIATYSFLVPMFTVVFAWTLLQQPLGFVDIIAMFMILGGTALVSRFRFRK